MIEWNDIRIIEYLEGVSQYAPGTGVERARKLLGMLGHPERKLKIIHVAGSNGKGSVCSYMSSALINCGYKTGLFTSPHLIDLRERIQIDGKMVSWELFVNAFSKVYMAEQKICEKEPEFKLAYFDYILGTAFLIFAQETMDFVVLETGLGGRLDASNAVEMPLLSVITTISLEHTAILGDTIEKIAAEKAGIIKKGIPVVYCYDNEISKKVIEDYAMKCGSRIIPVSSKEYEIMKNTGKDIAFSLHNEYYKNDCFLIATKALYQVMNASVALTSLAVLNEVYGVNLPKEAVRYGIYHMYWPGRMEEILPHVYIDGAHNPQGIKAFINSVNQICYNSKAKCATLLFAVVSDKDYEQMIHIIESCSYFKTVLITQTGGKRHLPKERIASQFAHWKKVEILEFDGVMDALEYGLSHDSDFLFCAGSLYLAGDIKTCLKEKQTIDYIWRQRADHDKF